MRFVEVLFKSENDLYNFFPFIRVKNKRTHAFLWRVCKIYFDQMLLHGDWNSCFVSDSHTYLVPVKHEHILQELKETFTPELAHAAYIPFCRLAGE